MILNKDKAIQTILSWLKTYIDNTPLSSFIIPVTDDINSVLLYLLCKRTQISTIAVAGHKNYITRQPCPLEGNVEITGCYSGSLFDFVKQQKGLLVGTLDREEYRLLRKYDKYGNGLADLLPLADLYKYELKELLCYLINEDIESFTKDPDSKVNKSSRNIEWADRLDDRYFIISGKEDPVTHHSWQTFTGEQQKTVARMHQIEKSTKHKYNPNLPVCKIRDIVGLVR